MRLGKCAAYVSRVCVSVCECARAWRPTCPKYDGCPTVEPVVDPAAVNATGVYDSAVVHVAPTRKQAHRHHPFTHVPSVLLPHPLRTHTRTQPHTDSRAHTRTLQRRLDNVGLE